jgi:glutaredoxin
MNVSVTDTLVGRRAIPWASGKVRGERSHRERPGQLVPGRPAVSRKRRISVDRRSPLRCPVRGWPGRNRGEALTRLTLQASGMSDDPSITLYRLQACPYCERVVRVLDEHGLDYRSRFVESMHSDRNVVKRLTGKRTVPAIVDERTGATMSESANIVRYLERTYGDVGAA